MRTASTYLPRHLRGAARGMYAADKARNAGKGALDCALADIAIRFDAASRINRHKQRVESSLRRGFMSEDVRCFYAPVAAMLLRLSVRTIDAAICVVSAEITRTAMIEYEVGRPRLTIRRETLDEAMLALRWLRRHRPIDMRLLVALMSVGPACRPEVHLIAAE